MIVGYLSCKDNICFKLHLNYWPAGAVLTWSSLITVKTVPVCCTEPHSPVGNVSDYRYMSDCRSRGCEFDPARYHTFMEIDHEIISKAILLPSADSRRFFVSYKPKYVHKELVNRLVKLAQENVVR